MGHIDISNLNTPPEQAEFETAKYFAALGKDVTFIRPSSIPNQHSPDILMDGIEWEIKCPKGHSKRTIENCIRAAQKQSHFIIIDLRRIKLSEKQCLSDIEKNYRTKPGVKRILVINKDLNLIQFPDQSN